MHFVFLFPPFFERDFRLKKRSKCPSWRSPALCRTRCQGRAVCVHGSGADGLDRTSGRGSALLRQEGQEKTNVCLGYFRFKKRGQASSVWFSSRVIDHLEGGQASQYKRVRYECRKRSQLLYCPSGEVSAILSGRLPRTRLLAHIYTSSALRVASSTTSNHAILLAKRCGTCATGARLTAWPRLKGVQSKRK